MQALEHPGFERLGPGMAPLDKPDYKWRVDIRENGKLYFFHGKTPRHALVVASRAIAKAYANANG
jgi:hypothetical protein